MIDAIMARVSSRESDWQYLMGNRRGYVQNAKGKKCWYSQRPTKNESVSHFYDSMTGADTVMTFDEPGCMAGAGVDLDINIGMINDVLANWYSKPDAAFKTSRDDLYTKSFMQVRGFCVQSRKYPSQAFLVDYFTKDGSIFMVVHNYALKGCG